MCSHAVPCHEYDTTNNYYLLLTYYSLRLIRIIIENIRTGEEPTRIYFSNIRERGGWGGGRVSLQLQSCLLYFTKSGTTDTLSFLQQRCFPSLTSMLINLYTLVSCLGQFRACPSPPPVHLSAFCHFCLTWALLWDPGSHVGAAKQVQI